MTRTLRLATVAVALALTGCATEVVDSVDTVAVDTAAPTTTLPSGPAEELLPRLVLTLRAVAEAIIDESDQRALLAEAEALWSVARPEVEAVDAEGAEEMEGMMDLARRAVERLRPADADKAAKFLGDLVDHHLGIS